MAADPYIKEVDSISSFFTIEKCYKIWYKLSEPIISIFCHSFKVIIAEMSLKIKLFLKNLDYKKKAPVIFKYLCKNVNTVQWIQTTGVFADASEIFWWTSKIFCTRELPSLIPCQFLIIRNVLIYFKIKIWEKGEKSIWADFWCTRKHLNVLKFNFYYIFA